MQELNIVELIESNPISKLSHTYNSKLITKIQENFTGFEQSAAKRRLLLWPSNSGLGYRRTGQYLVGGL